VKLSRADLKGVGLSALLCSTPLAFMSFEFMFPNISTPAYGKNLLLIMGISILCGIPAGYLNRRVDLAIVSVLVYTMVGYGLAFLFYSVPYTVFGAEQILAEVYYLLFLRFTVVLVFLFIFGGFMGAVAGQLIKDSTGRRETRVLWEEPSDR
jgi:hypothetical protein